MNNILNGLQRFLKNKNTITIIGVLFIIGILYFGYTKQIENQVKPIRNVPVAKVTIQPGTLVTADMVETISVPTISMRSQNVFRNVNLVIGKYTDYNTVIPEGSMFFSDVLVERDDLPSSLFVKVQEGHIPSQLRVDINSTFGNEIMPGNKVDIYMRVVNENRQIMIGKLFENIEILSVKDSGGKNVFSDSSTQSNPSMFIFGLAPEYHNLLLKAQYMSAFSIELFPVPHGGNIEVETETRVSSSILRSFIEAYSVPNPELSETDFEDYFGNIEQETEEDGE